MSFSTCEGYASGVLYASFSQNFSSLAIGRSTGYNLYQLDSIDELKPIYSGNVRQVCLVERLFSSGLVAVVSIDNPRILRMFNFRKGIEIWKMSYSNTITTVKMNREVFIVVLEKSIHIHSSKDMKVLHVISDAPCNGILALSSFEDKSWLAYPCSHDNGMIQLFDTKHQKNGLIINAHNNLIAAICFDRNTTLLATASHKGTVIRVFGLDGKKVYELRRGLTRNANISSITFNSNGEFLVVSSNTQTVHIFKLCEENKIHDSQQRPASSSSSSTEDNSWFGYLNQSISAITSYIPETITEAFVQNRAFATARLPFTDLKSICVMTSINKQNYLLVVASDGLMYIYQVNVTSGECILIKQHLLDVHPPCKPITSPSNTYADVIKGSGDALVATSTIETASSSQVGLPLDYSGQYPPMQS